jgi:hypothetical protein
MAILPECWHVISFWRIDVFLESIDPACYQRPSWQAVALVFARVSPSLLAMREAWLTKTPAQKDLDAAGGVAGTGGGTGGMSACVQTAFLLFEDLCALAAGSAGSWMRAGPGRYRPQRHRRDLLTVVA